jgi:hypothetical protein
VSQAAEGRIVSAPYLSVVMPARNGERVLRESLPALVASDLPRDQWELIVVDDASVDRTVAVADDYADGVVQLNGAARGPAHARNRGVEASRGEIIVFIDADVCVHADTLGRIASAFRADETMAALFGSYDATPRAPGVVSGFRNLLHHHVHQMNAGDAETFWAGCGAVRRHALLAVGMMDAERYPRPQIEDIELGRRLRRHGYRIVLRPDIQGTHLKRWTLRNMVVTDFRDRGVPWMRLLLSEGRGTPATLNVKPREKLCTALTGSAVIAGTAALWFRSGTYALVALAAVLLTVALNLRFYRLLRRRRGSGCALAAVPLHLLFYVTAGLAAVTGVARHLLERERGPAERPAEPSGPTYAATAAREDVNSRPRALS